MRRAFASVVGVVFVVLSLTSAPAAASCAGPVPLDQALADASAVFVGTVVELRFDDRVALFDVEDVWKGDLAATAEVNGGPRLADLHGVGQGQSVATSVDRTYRLGKRYLVVSYGFDQDALSDNACSATQQYTDDLAGFRPADAPGAAAVAIRETKDAEEDSVLETEEASTPVDATEGVEKSAEIASGAGSEDNDDGTRRAWLLAAAALLGAGAIAAILRRRQHA